MNGMKQIGKLGLALLLAAALGACGMTRASHRPPAPINTVKTVSVDQLNPKKGSIWMTTDRNTLFLDNKARNVGDLITVLVSETSSASKAATTSLSRKGQNDIDLGTVFGLSTGLIAKGNQYLGTTSEMESTQAHTGSGTTTRNGTLTATVSCTVIEVLHNGNLRIEGRRDITVNHENQFIILSGIIRPEDISPSNSVLSAQVADARIDFSGEGDVDGQQRPNFLHRILQAFPVL